MDTAGMGTAITATGMAITGTVIGDATTTTGMAIGIGTITLTVTAVGGAVTGMDTAWVSAGAGRLTVMSGSATESK